MVKADWKQQYIGLKFESLPRWRFQTNLRKAIGDYYWYLSGHPFFFITSKFYCTRKKNQKGKVPNNRTVELYKIKQKEIKDKLLLLADQLCHLQLAENGRNCI